MPTMTSRQQGKGVKRRSLQAIEFKQAIHSSQKPEMDVLWNIFRAELRSAMIHTRKKIRSCSVRREMYEWICLF